MFTHFFCTLVSGSKFTPLTQEVIQRAGTGEICEMLEQMEQGMVARFNLVVSEIIASHVESMKKNPKFAMTEGIK